MNKFHHLLSQTAFKLLVPCFVCIPQRVKYTGPSILRIDYKCNPVAHVVLAAPFTQYRLEMFKYEKSWSHYLYICSKYLLDLPELVGSHDAPISSDLLHGSIDIHSRPILIFDYQIFPVFLSLLRVQVHQLFMSVWYIVTHDGSLFNKHRRER